ncbi:MAG: N-acetyltransferase [Alphaproteobacteria bacterium]|nr:N-acetyltransferase [Alphaproteobacteria bacterium]
MALFGIRGFFESSPIIRGESLYLRAPEMRDYAQWVHQRAASRAFLTPWEPDWLEDELSRASFRRRIQRQADDIARDDTYPFFIFDPQTHVLMGGITLGQVRRGIAQAGTIGYWMAQDFANQGHMTRAVRALVDYGFAHLRLHRIEAACLPNNLASMRLLERNGFHKEGLARSYLRINGQWRDHVLYALLDGDPR